jgi:hypothetical protein
MPPKRNYRRTIALSLGAAIILAVLILPIRVPYSIHATCKIVPVKEWVVEKNSLGTLNISLYDHKNGSVEMSSFDPGSVAGFKFYPHSDNMGLIKQGDTLGYIELLPAGITEKKKEVHTIVSPITGTLSNQMNDTVLISIRDVSEFMVLIPLRLNEKDYVSAGQTIEVKIPGTRDSYEGKIVKTGDELQILNKNQYTVLVGVLNVLTKDILPGIIAKCTVECPPVRVYEYVARSLNSTVNEQ